MAEHTEPDPLAAATGELPDVDWSALMTSETPAAALRGLARWLGPRTVALTLDSEGSAVARWVNPEPIGSSRERRAVPVAGDPPWQLTATLAEGTAASAARLEHAGRALEAWRRAHSGRSRAASRLAARTRELDLIQSLGRRAARAQSPAELFAATVSVVQQAEPLDLALVASSYGSSPEVIAFVARPFEARCLRRLVGRAAEMVGWTSAEADERPVVERRLEEFEPSLGPRSDFRERDLVLLPILRRNRPVACLLLLPSGGAEQGRLRLLYSAANQLGVHLDRILTGREAMADRFRTILDSMPQAVVLADRELRVVQCNRSAQTLLERVGLPNEGSLERGLGDLGLTSIVDRVRRGGAALADGELGWGDDATISLTVSPLAGTGADDRGLVLVFSDVTESRRIQQRLAQSEKMSSLGQLISGTAHELNNPLASVLGYAQLLRASIDAEADAENARRLEVLEREAERCQKIVHNLLAFARQRAPERRPVSLNEIVESSLALMRYQLRVENIEVKTRLDPGLPPLQGDPHQLQQVLINLLGNAKDAIRTSAEHGEIHVRTTATNSAVVLEVSDSGPGVPAEVRSRIFDPFYTTKAEGKGTGLGLSIVYGIVSSHGGTIDVRSTKATVGACFRLRLPRAEVDPPPAVVVVEPAAPPLERRGRVLVVDDEWSVAQMIRDVLVADGYEAEAVTDGIQALERVSDTQYDLIIADVRMPGMDAPRLHAELERSGGELASRLLLTTGDTVSGEPDDFAARAGLELLSKPFDVEQLRRRVRECIAASGDS